MDVGKGAKRRRKIDKTRTLDGYGWGSNGVLLIFSLCAGLLFVRMCNCYGLLSFDAPLA